MSTEMSRPALPLSVEGTRRVYTGGIRILSIDGGGIRGLIPATILEYIENETGKRIQDLFHYISGTSTGGILSLGLSLQKPLSGTDLVNMYSTKGSKIFQKHLSFFGMTDSVYTASGLEETLHSILGDQYLSDLSPNVNVLVRFTTLNFKNKLRILLKTDPNILY